MRTNKLMPKLMQDKKKRILKMFSKYIQGAFNFSISILYNKI